jgi:hypothetical protein
MKLMFSRIRDGCAMRAQREHIRIAAAVLAGVTVFFAARALGASDPSAVTDLAGSALTAEQIVAKNIEARGGLDAWRKVESMIWLGHIDGEGAPSPDVKFVLEQKRPNKSRFEMKSANQDSVRVYDGTRGWKVRTGKGADPEVQPFTPEEIRAARETSDIETPLMGYAEKGIAISLEGRDEVEGRRAYRLNMRLPSGVSHHVWIDAETFLDVKYDRVSRNAAGLSAQVSVYYREFKNVDGLRIPGVIETGIGAARPTDRMVIEKIAVNPPLNDQTFTKPRAVARHWQSNSNTVTIPRTP